MHYSGAENANRYLEGNPLDRTILAAVLIFAVIVLARRGRMVLMLLRSNGPILLYFFYCSISFIWSDFPDVSFKRWFRAVGDFVMVLVVLTDPAWYEAVKRFLTRVGFLVIPLSVLFIRYFPELGRSYSKGGQPAWTGVATDKNALGIMSVVFGLAAIYYLFQLYGKAQDGRNKYALVSYGVIALTAVYLLYESHSATALSCFLLAGSVMVITQLFPKARSPVFLNLAVALALLVPFSAMFLGIGSGLVESIGRNTTFTGRTAIWQCSFSMVRNVIVGEGFESFWLGHRLTDVERCVNQGLNQAHNGYIEIFLNLGWIGVVLLVIILITAYRRGTAAARLQTPLGSLRLAYFIVAVAYNFSEGGFKMMNPVWIALLLAIAIPSEETSMGPAESFPKNNLSKSINGPSWASSEGRRRAQDKKKRVRQVQVFGMTSFESS